MTFSLCRFAFHRSIKRALALTTTSLYTTDCPLHVERIVTVSYRDRKIIVFRAARLSCYIFTRVWRGRRTTVCAYLYTLSKTHRCVLMGLVDGVSVRTAESFRRFVVRRRRTMTDDTTTCSLRLLQRERIYLPPPTNQ